MWSRGSGYVTKGSNRGNFATRNQRESTPTAGPTPPASRTSTSFSWDGQEHKTGTVRTCSSLLYHLACWSCLLHMKTNMLKEPENHPGTSSTKKEYLSQNPCDISWKPGWFMTKFAYNSSFFECSCNWVVFHPLFILLLKSQGWSRSTGY